MTEARRRYVLIALAASALTLTGCQDLFMVELGRKNIAAVVVNRAFPTGLSDPTGCPAVDRTYHTSGGDARIVVAQLTEGCLLAVHLDEAELLNEGTMKLWAKALKGYDLSALISIDIIIDQFRLDAGREHPFGADQVQALSIALDKRVLVQREDLARIESGENDVRIPIPQELVESFREVAGGR